MPRGKKSKYQTNGSGSIKELLDELFQAAIKLRGTIEPGDYKRYVPPIIFPPFPPLPYGGGGAGPKKMVKDEQSEFFGVVDPLENPDEFPPASGFPNPPEARWENIR